MLVIRLTLLGLICGHALVGAQQLHGQVDKRSLSLGAIITNLLQKSSDLSNAKVNAARNFQKKPITRPTTTTTTTTTTPPPPVQTIIHYFEPNGQYQSQYLRPAAPYQFLPYSKATGNPFGVYITNNIPAINPPNGPTSNPGFINFEDFQADGSPKAPSTSQPPAPSTTSPPPPTTSTSLQTLVFRPQPYGPPPPRQSQPNANILNQLLRLSYIQPVPRNSFANVAVTQPIASSNLKQGQQANLGFSTYAYVQPTQANRFVLPRPPPQQQPAQRVVVIGPPNFQLQQQNENAAQPQTPPPTTTPTQAAAAQLGERIIYKYIQQTDDTFSNDKNDGDYNSVPSGGGQVPDTESSVNENVGSEGATETQAENSEAQSDPSPDPPAYSPQPQLEITPDPPSRDAQFYALPQQPSYAKNTQKSFAQYQAYSPSNSDPENGYFTYITDHGNKNVPRTSSTQLNDNQSYNAQGQPYGTNVYSNGPVPDSQSAYYPY